MNSTRFTVVLTAITVLTALTALPAPSAHAGKVYPAWVIPDTLNVRSGPGTDRDVIGSLTKGTKVHVTAFADNWCWAKLPDGRWGWIAEWLLQFSYDKGRALAEEAGVSNDAPAPSSGSSSGNPPAWIKPETTNVRSGPGTHYDKRGQLQRGTKVYIVKQERGWSKCRTPGGYGWIRDDLLERDATSGRKLSDSQSSPHTQSTSSVNRKAFVNGTGVRLRSGPGTNYSIKTKLTEGQTIFVEEQRGEWLSVSVQGGNSGWIHGNLVKYADASGTSSGSAESVRLKGFVKGSRVHLRGGPSLNDHIRAKVVKGQTLYITQRSGDWYKATVHGGEEGWIHSSLVKLPGTGKPSAPEAAPDTPDEPSQPKELSPGRTVEDLVGWIAEDIVNVRYGPGTDHDIKVKLSQGTKVEVLELNGHWCKIKSPGGVIGWVAGWVMNFKGPGEDPTVKEGDQEIGVRTAWVARPEVNLRAGPGTDHEEIAEAVLGTEVIILDSEGDWYRVALDNGKTGWMASWLLDTRAQRRVRQGEEEMTAPAAPSSFGRSVVDTAKQYLGCQYVRGGASPSGFDCSGFVHYVLGQHGVNVSRSSRTQFREGSPVSRGNLQVGDVVFFRNTYRAGISHVGIYIGNGQFIHASNRRSDVKISDLDSSYYAPRYAGARRMR